MFDQPIKPQSLIFNQSIYFPINQHITPKVTTSYQSLNIATCHLTNQPDNLLPNQLIS